MAVNVLRRYVLEVSIGYPYKSATCMHHCQLISSLVVERNNMLKMHDIPTVYGGSTIPPKELKRSSKVCCTLHSPLAMLAVGILIGFSIGYALVCFETLTGWYKVEFVDFNFTTAVKSEHLELTSGLAHFLQLVEEINESLSPYSESIICKLKNDVQKGITDLKDLQESTKPKVRRRPPLET